MSWISRRKAGKIIKHILGRCIRIQIGVIITINIVHVAVSLVVGEKVDKQRNEG